MPVLSFPTVDAYRAALASGAVPAALARGPASGAVDAAGRVWVERPAPTPAASPAPPVPLRPLVGWAELVPPQRTDPDPPTGPILVAGPASHLARLAASASPAGVLRLWPGLPPTLMLPARPAVVPEGVTEFWPQVPRVWVPAGWRHPLPELLAAPPGCHVIVRPEGPWLVVPDKSAVAPRDGFPVSARCPMEPVHGQPDPIRVPLAARSVSLPESQECFWLMVGDLREHLRTLAAEVPEATLRRLAVAAVTDGGGNRRVLLRLLDARRRLPYLLPAAQGYVRHPTVPGVHLPAGRALRPNPRPAALAALTEAADERIVWLGATDTGRVSCDTAPTTAFRPLMDHVAYTAPAVRRLTPVPVADPFPFGLVAPPDDRPLVTDPLAFVVRSTASHAESLPPGPGQPGWVRRIAARIRGHRTAEASAGSEHESGVVTVPAARVEPRTVSVRQSALEQRILTRGPRAEPLGRAEAWAELAAVYDLVGDPTDAAVCWLNAVWDHPAAPQPWVARWLQAEARGAGRGGRGAGRTAAVRLVAASAAGRDEAAGLVKLLDAHEADVPVRAVWLARTAVARAFGGDPLGLARCRDRLFRRLAAGGPKLDVDTPRFLRFHNRGGERATAVRNWLAAIREPVRHWLGRPDPAGRLQWAGLDPEVTATAAYADLMLAWGSAKAADRDTARELTAAATTVLARGAGSPGHDVHRQLLATFRARIDAALDGTPDRPLPAPEPADGPDDLARYAVDALRSHSGILEPFDRVSRFGGRELVGFLGADDLGTRLRALLADPDRVTPAALADLRATIADDPTASTLPRAMFTALELAPRAGGAAVADILPDTVRAIDLLPEWARLSHADGDPAASARRFGPRMMSAAAHAIRLFHLPDACRQLIDALTAAGPSAPSGVAATRTAASLFRACRRLGVDEPAGRLLSVLSAGSQGGERDLGVAVGRFTVGDSDRAMRTLDAARTRLFAADRTDPRRRTALALAYADALGHAPVGVALGRLGELFTRLGPITVHGATNRYFTLKPLALIDTVVRAVVGDEFELGPAVRGWLDDDEYLTRRRITRDLDRALAGR